MSNEDLNRIRQRIDTLDEQIQQLISERGRCAQQVAELKQSNGETSFYKPEREAAILKKIRQRNAGPLPDEEMVRIFREIISACLALEERLNVAYLGPEGTFSQAAALKHFGHSINCHAQSTIEEVFRSVMVRESHFGVVPIENSTEGIVNRTLDAFINHSLVICGEIELRIEHQLLSHQDRLEAVQRVYGNEQALAQCRRWLEHHLPQARRVAVTSNGEAARRAAEDSDAAAVAGQNAADIYSVPVIARNIEDETDNSTRFLVVGRYRCPPTGHDKTTLLVAVNNKPGALYRLLTPLAQAGVSMTKIESRPSRRQRWEYVFFIDIEGHQDEPSIAGALAEMKGDCLMFKILGSYPRSVL